MAPTPALSLASVQRASPARLAVFTALFALALLPVLSTTIPAMVDYPNHLARMIVLARDGTPAAQPFYRVTWAFSPNLAMDLVVPPLARWMSVEAATRLFLLACQVLTVTGACAIELAVKRRFEASGFLALMVLYSAPFAWGFVNFQFGLGVGLWGIACWMILQDRPWPLRLAVHSAFVALLFCAHLFALGLYGFTLGLHELWRARDRKPPLRVAVARFAGLAAPAVALLLVMAAVGGQVGAEGTVWNAANKLRAFTISLNGYSAGLSLAGTVVLLVLAYGLAKRRALRMVQSGGWLLVGLGLLFVIMPSTLFDTAFVDLRILVAAMLIVPGFVAFAPPSRAVTRWASAIILGITLVNLGSALAVARSYRSDYAALIASFGQLGHGARILAGHSGEGADPPLADLAEYPIYNAPTLAVAYADAFVPTLFTSAGKQPIAVREPFRRLSVPYGGPVPVAVLRAIARGMQLDGLPSYVADWTRDFDYLYLLGPEAPNPLPGLLSPLSSGTRFTLYRINRPADASHSVNPHADRTTIP